MRRPIAVFAMTCLIALAPAGNAWACSCAPPGVKGRIARADAVFAGLVATVDTAPDWRANAKATLRVDRVYKGDVPSPVIVETPRTEAACGVGFVPGATYTVFAEVHDRALVTEWCHGTVAGDDLLGERPWREPLQLVASTAASSSRTGALWAAALLLGVGMGGSAHAFVRRRGDARIR